MTEKYIWTLEEIVIIKKGKKNNKPRTHAIPKTVRTSTDKTKKKGKPR